MEEKSVYAVGLDAGSSRTRFAVGLLEPSGLRVIGFGQAESEGWVKGRIADQRAAADSILRAVRDAEAAAGVTDRSQYAPDHSVGPGARLPGHRYESGAPVGAGDRP